VNRLLRVGLVTYGLDRPMSGINRYTSELGRALAQLPGIELTYLTPYREGEFAALPGRYYLPSCARLPGLMALGGAALGLAAARLQLDIVHDPSGVSPFWPRPLSGRYRRVVTIYDAIAFRYPEGYNRVNNFLNRSYLPRMLRFADAVITISRAAGQDIESCFKQARGKIHYSYPACDVRFQPASAAEMARVIARYDLRPPFILYLGALEARKNVDGLLRAYAELTGEGPAGVQLVIGGKPTWKHQGIGAALAALDLGDRVKFTGYVADEDLPALYSAAAVFAFPSHYEGFGLPVLEAMACGTPVVCANNSSLPEIAANAALTVEADDTAALAAALAAVLSSPRRAAEMRQRGLARAAQFSWQATATAVAEVYERLVD
jgi:glycosyltransferase involved in cell wall biosynthesis